MHRQVIENKLERLLDDYSDWKKIYGEKVPLGYIESKDRAKEREQFENQVEELRRQLQNAK